MKHVYRHPNATGSTGAPKDPESVMEDFLVFFEDLYLELSKFGRLEGLYVVDNVGDHMVGHVYAKFSDEEEAADAIEKLQGRYYDGILLDCEYSPVTDFREARCRDYDEETCSRAGFCNFLHVKPVPAALIRSLDEDVEAQRRLKQQEEEDEKRMLKAQQKKSKRRRDEGSHKRSKRSRRSRSRSSSASRSSDEGEGHD